MARKRDYAAEYARRQARARELGFGGYYQRRTAGTAPGSERARARGHRGRQDLLRAVREGDVVSVVSTSRSADGRYTRIELSHLSARTGRETTYTLRGGSLTDKRIGELAGAFTAAGVIQPPTSGGSNSIRDIYESLDDAAAEEAEFEDSLLDEDEAA